MVTVKVWQLMLLGLAVLAAAFMMLRPSSSVPAAGPAPAVSGSPIAVSQLRASLPAVKAWAAKHHGYLGMKLPKGVTVVSATKDTFCIEVGGVFKNGPTAPTLPGACPRP